jgi:hypothetical protein
VFADAVKLTLPLPEPLLPLVMVSQAAPLVAVHVQPVPAVTVDIAFPPAAGTVWLSGVTMKLQEVPLCVIVTVCPATLNVPTR